MNLRLMLPAAAAIFLAASCTPYVEPPPPAPTDPAANKTTEEEKKKAAELKEKKRKEANDIANKEKSPEGETPGPDGGGNPDPDKTPPKKPEEKSAEIKTAKPVPGRPGFVFSPYNNRMINVTDIPSGRLARDPTYPASEKKYFRVP